MATYKYELKMALKEYPTLFPNENEFLHHLFFVLGNGYKWEKGQLVSVFSKKEGHQEKENTDKYFKKMKVDLEKIIGKKLSPMPPNISTEIYPLSNSSKISTIPDNIDCQWGSDWLDACEKALKYSSTLKRNKNDDKWLKKAKTRVKELKKAGDYTWMCPSCWGLNNAIEIGMLAPGYSLVKQNKRYFILGGQGHAGEDLYSFRSKPHPAPGYNNKNCDKHDVWFETYGVKEMGRKFSYYDAKNLIASCKKAGWSQRRNGDLCLWLYDRSGRLLKKFEEKFDRNATSPEVDNFLLCLMKYEAGLKVDYSKELLPLAAKASKINPWVVAYAMGQMKKKQEAKTKNTSTKK